MSLIYNNETYPLEPQESVLNCFLRHGVAYPHSCQIGICQSCLIKTNPENIDPHWQTGLPETLKIQGYFLACLAKPTSPLQVSTPNHSECEVEATIIEINLLNHNVMQIKLITKNLNVWIPGQYLNLINAEEIMRSYSIANIPTQDNFIELHIKLVPEGRMGKWLTYHNTQPNLIKLRGPFGHCFYHNPMKENFHLLLAGTGTGLAPLVAILKNALIEHHPGKITLIHGGVREEDIYYETEIKKLIQDHPNVNYAPCVLQSKGRFSETAIEKQLSLHLTDTTNTHVFVCGPKETTNKLKKTAFLAGIPSRCIFSDAF